MHICLFGLECTALNSNASSSSTINPCSRSCKPHQQNLQNPRYQICEILKSWPWVCTGSCQANSFLGLLFCSWVWASVAHPNVGRTDPLFFCVYYVNFLHINIPCMFFLFVVHALSLPLFRFFASSFRFTLNMFLNNVLTCIQSINAYTKGYLLQQLIPRSLAAYH